MRRGENWCILGPNGSGKTTLLNLIYAEHPQAYANDVRVFGNRRGDGESIWALRRRLGIVTPHLQSRYEKRLDTLEVIVSGFFDSIGLFRRPSATQMEAAKATASAFGIGQLLGRPFDQLSSGERMLVLIARAMVKAPDLLILDEPCQGLDPTSRRRVLEAADVAAGPTDRGMIYVSHHDDEIPRSVTRTLRLG